MISPPCNNTVCMEPSIQERVITRDLGLPNLDFMVDGMTSTLDDCFDDMQKIMYGSRVITKLIDDESCDDPRYESICQDLIAQNRIVSEENCQTPG